MLRDLHESRCYYKDRRQPLKTDIIDHILNILKERWKDERKTSGEGILIKMTEPNEVIEFELSKELKEKLRGIFYDTDSNFLNVYR